jgi:hypothetical protein
VTGAEAVRFLAVIQPLSAILVHEWPLSTLDGRSRRLLMGTAAASVVRSTAIRQRLPIALAAPVP